MTRMSPKKTSDQLEREIAEALSKPQKATRRKAKKSAFDIRTERLKALQEVMTDVLGDDGWLETDIEDIEKWISVEDDLTDGEWLDTAKEQLTNESVLPEHAGAPPPNVREWNRVFISTYRVNVDDGMSHEDAVDIARQNAYDEVTLKSNEHGLTKTDPELYPTNRRGFRR